MRSPTTIHGEGQEGANNALLYARNRSGAHGLGGDGMTERPLAIDMFSGLGGWAEGLIAEGWRVIGVDIEDMFAACGATKPDHYELMLRDVLTIHGSELKDASLIVSSSPCTEYSYMAMPWTRAKQIARALRGQDEFPEGYKGSRTIADLNALFDAQFRIQREASEAAGRTIPMVVENVKGAQPWVGRAAWAYGSYFLWGDVPALMPIQKYHQRQKVKAGEQWNINRPNFTGTRGWDEGLKNPGFRFDGSGRSFQSASVERHVEGRKGSQGYERDHPNAFGWKIPATSSRSPARKAASAAIAKIPLALSRHIARVYYPMERAA